MTDKQQVSPARQAENGTSAETYLSGTQALVRVIVDRMRADRRAGLRTASFVSGYPGSPLGTFDLALERSRTLLAELDITHVPGLNEELAATAVMGSQLSVLDEYASYDGVVGYWYGKAPGLDRASDALRHATFAGTGARSGAVTFVGDDPANRSSTLPSSSEGVLEDLRMPIFVPGGADDILRLGWHAVELSRLSGLWCALRLTSTVADGKGMVPAQPTEWPVQRPASADRLNPEIRLTGMLVNKFSLATEESFSLRLDIARDYLAANDINQVTQRSSADRLGIVAAGQQSRVVASTLHELGLEAEDLGRLGIRLIHLGAVFPLDPGQIAEFCAGLDTVLVVEEKRPYLERAIRDLAYEWSSRPRILGKRDASGRDLIPADGALDASRLFGPLRRALADYVPADQLRPTQPVRTSLTVLPLAADNPTRSPFFCAGCPHCTSLQVPEGSAVGAGIGCHGMVARLPSERVGTITGYTQMGGEGAQWVGMAPFVGRKHYFQNLGDGTLAHSGYLAIRFARASGVNVTYKILYNSTVAMTGGQDAPGALSIPDLCRALLAEGVQRIVVTTDDRRRYRKIRLPRRVQVRDRSEIVAVQEELRAVPGVTALIHDQQCAAELKRFWKRNPDRAPDHRLMIASRVCEGCGDCSAKAACIALQPVDTEFGPKMAIEQATCNIDTSCLRGDCPSFVKVKSARRAPMAKPAGEPRRDLPTPTQLRADSVSIRLPGIGGTGVVTVAQILGTAAKLDGLEVIGLDQTGLSQKSGPVVSDLRISTGVPAEAASPADGEADLYLVMDLVVGLMPENTVAISRERTRIVGSTSIPTLSRDLFDREVAVRSPEQLQAQLDALTDGTRNVWLDALESSRRLLGRSTTANMLLLGAALQAGALPVGVHAVEQAIRQNNVAVEENLRALYYGRLAVADRAEFEREVSRRPRRPTAVPAGVEARIDRLELDDARRERLHVLSAQLVDFQSAALAYTYLDLVTDVRAAERAVDPASAQLFDVVVEQYFRVLAYKDEYEVARLLLLPETSQEIEAVGGPGARASWMLHPPMLRRLGRHNKIALGPWARPALAALRSMRRLRGTPIDPFGRTEVRRNERRLAREYATLCARLAAELPSIGIDRAARLAGLVQSVRGYEQVKLANLARYEDELRDQLEQLVSPSPTP